MPTNMRIIKLEDRKTAKEPGSNSYNKDEISPAHIDNTGINKILM